MIFGEKCKSEDFYGYESKSIDFWFWSGLVFMMAPTKWKQPTGAENRNRHGKARENVSATKMVREYLPMCSRHFISRLG